MKYIQTCSINNQYVGNIAYVSCDPVTSDIHPYSVEDSSAIEDAFSRGESEIQLSIFGGVTITKKGSKYSQRTTTGYRSVARVEVKDGKIEKEVEFNKRLKSWYFSDHKQTHICKVVDTSGSMYQIYSSLIEQGCDVFLEEQKKLETDVKFYGLTFSNDVHVVFNGVDLKTEDTIKETFYKIKPSGSTCYYDAVCKAIEILDSAYDSNDEVIMCILTDGMDNASATPMATMVTEIKKRKDIGWNIVMIGTDDIDTLNVADQYGISRNSSLTVGRTVGEQQAMYRNLNAGLERVRGGVSNNVDFTDQERAGCYQSS